MHMEVGITEPCAASFAHATKKAVGMVLRQRSEHFDHSVADVERMAIVHDSSGR